MILSMTGYGKASVCVEKKKIIAEIKSLNSKALDLSTRICPLYREKEMEIRQMISTALERGKVDFSLWIEEDASCAATPINHEIIKAYDQQLRQVAQEINIEISTDTYLQTILRLPEVFISKETPELDEQQWEIAKEVIASAIQHLVEFRQQEGLSLEKKFNEKIDNIEHLLSELEPFETDRITRIRSRILETLEKEIGSDFDHNRMEQELIYYIEKLDINEEKQRLRNHLNYFRQTMQTGHGQGKKLGFIAQEMGREINTTGSKSNQAEMQNIVVQMKDELEQIKEQVLNVM